MLTFVAQNSNIGSELRNISKYPHPFPALEVAHGVASCSARSGLEA